MKLDTIADLFSGFGGSTAVARAIGKGQSTASEMKRRGSIPVEHWQSLIENERGRKLGLTAEVLMRMHASSGSSRPTSATEAA